MTRMRYQLALAFVPLCAFATTGCVTTTYDAMLADVDVMMTAYANADSEHGKPAPKSEPVMKLPWAQARFCLRRASSARVGEDSP